jgi:stage V sporulation protein D (sporulation-specific penicillin-binding protein)
MQIKKRIAIVYLVIIFSFAMLFIRLAYVKIEYNDEYYYKALDLWTRNIKSNLQRGEIYDRNNNLIVGNKITNTVYVIPKQINDKRATSKALANIFGVDENIIFNDINKNVSIVELKKYGKNIDFSKATAISKLNIKGVYLLNDSVRDYAYGNTLAQTLGIVGIDNQGITGLEYIYDELIKGSTNTLNIYTDGHGNLLDDFSIDYKENELGYNLYLTIDLAIQLSLERVMYNAYTKYDAEWILGLVMNPKTSEIYAIANYPTFDLNNYQEYDQELYNRN